MLSYEDLMQRVLSSAGPSRGKAQYMSAVWTQSEEQAKIATKVAKRLGKQDAVPILPSASWHDAEDYHQKYYEKQTVSRGAGRRR